MTTMPLKILVVDDSRANLLILQEFLRNCGHTVIAASGGEEAVRLYAEDPPDLVLMDIVMPGVDGLEATRRIRTLPSTAWVPVVFLSALDRDEHLLEGLEAGGDDYIAKPINFPLLGAKVRAMQRTLGLQQKVADSLRQLQTISDNVLEAIITIDSDATITSCNSVTELLFGWTAEELVGENVRILCPEPYRSEHDGYVRNYVNGGPPKIIGQGREVLAQRRDGTTFPAELSVSEVRQAGHRMFIGVIRDISDRKRDEARLRENAEKLQRYYEASEAENQLASDLIERQMRRGDLDDPLVEYWVSPALHFSGDVLAAARSESGDLFALLADATGHGLAAAISTLPVLTLFYQLVHAGAGISRVAGEINRQLLEAMPVGRFVAATLVRIDRNGSGGEVLVAGMPSARLLDCNGVVIREFASAELPLGIVPASDGAFLPVGFEWSGEGCQLLLCSDGLLEAESGDQIHFGSEKLASTLHGVPSGERVEAIRHALARHLGTRPPQDDVSLLLLSRPGCEHDLAQEIAQ